MGTRWAWMGVGPLAAVALLGCDDGAGGPITLPNPTSSSSSGGGTSSTTGDGGAGAGTATGGATASGGAGGQGGGTVDPGPYPAGPYGNMEGDVLPLLAWEGHFNPKADKLAADAPYIDFSSDDARQAGSPFILVHTAAVF